jgi:hypothetical protein
VFGKEFELCDFLSNPIEAIQRMKDEHSYCGKCAAVGGHAYVQAKQFTKPKPWLDTLKFIYATKLPRV